MFARQLRCVLRRIVPESDLIDASVAVSDRQDLSDYQSNIAMRLASRRKKDPLSIAQEIADGLRAELAGIHVTVASPGFINVTLSEDFLVSCLNDVSCFDEKTFAPRKIVMDYGAPNIAKPLHVGHLRSAVIGESVKRTLRCVGHEVLGDVHLGDWGTQMGKVLYGVQKKFPEVFSGDLSLLTFDHLEACYKSAADAFNADTSAAQEMRVMTFQLQQGDGVYRRVWKRVRDLSVENVRSLYERLNVSFDMWYGESRYQPVMEEMCADFERSGFARRDDGALIVDVADDSQPKMPPVILQKSDGGFLYATTDTATMQERVVDMGAEEVIYVVDARQGLHFEQIFRLAKKVGWTSNFRFLGFGTVNGEDGKPFKTRDGGTFKLEALLDDLREAVRGYAQERGRELDEKAIETVAMAALKVGDLQQDLRHNYTFSVQKFAQFEGCTGPYLLYTYARMASVLAKAGDTTVEALCKLVTPEERALSILLLQYQEVVALAAHKCAPHILCQYAFSLAGAFNALYQRVSILQASREMMLDRLALCQMTRAVLKKVLGMLGLDVLERM